jgi:uncharacterized membrane protein YadS
MKKIRWDLIGILGGTAGVIIAIRAVLKAGGPNSSYIAIALIVVFGGMGYFLYKFLWQPKFNIRDCNWKAFPAKRKF